jgi:heat shock protein HslJ
VNAARTALFLFVGVALGCGASEGDRGVPAVEVDPLVVPTPRVPEPEEVEAAMFRGLAGVDGPVTLRNGRWEGEPPHGGGASREVVELLGRPRLQNDFDDDGRDEVVVLLTSSGGGSGVFLNLAVVERTVEGVVSRAVTLVGDRVQVRGARADGPLVVLDLVQHGEDDPLCCPGDLATRVWRVEGSQLRQVREEITGRLHPHLLAGSEWILRTWPAGEGALPEPEISLAFERGKISGHSGCNGFFSAYESGDLPGSVRFGPVGATRRMCEPDLMELERRYLALLGGAVSLGYKNERLALSSTEDGRSVQLLFERR